jgi:predicted DNA-binding transcriptional regulator AlpA
MRTFARTTTPIPVVLDRGISETAAAEILGISVDTLRRMGKRNEGPKRRRVSPRRVSYSERECYAYLEASA